MAARKLTDGELVRALLDRARKRTLEPGQIHGMLTADGYTLKFDAEIARVVEADELTRHRTDAIARLTARPYDLKCGAYTKGPQFSSFAAGGRRSSHRCERPIVAAVVLRDLGRGPSYYFVCGTHRDHHGVDPRNVVATIELPRHLLLSAYEALARVEADSARRHREQEAADEAAARAALCPFCKASPGEPCRWPADPTGSPLPLVHGARRPQQH